MRIIIAMTVLGVVILSGSLLSTITGVGVTTGRSETVPVSVRSNPSSYRPVYGTYSGYHTPVSSSGGYSAGK